MKHAFVLILIPTLIFAGSGRYQPKNAGVLFRGTYWDHQTDNSGITVVNQGLDNQVSVSGYGGWIDFFSRLNDQLFMHWAMGSSADVKVTEQFLSSNQVYTKSISPLIMGLRYNLIPLKQASAMQPYVMAGAGPYWEHETRAESRFLSDQTTLVKSRLLFGLNAGCGAIFRLSNHFVLNFDMKYHFVDADVNHAFSGLSAGFGFGWLWGND